MKKQVIQMEKACFMETTRPGWGMILLFFHGFHAETP